MQSTIARRRAALQMGRPSERYIHPVKINRTGRRIGWFQSVTTGSSHPFHSKNEFAWLHLLDCLPGVRDFSAQAERLVIPGGDRPQRYTPDTKVILHDGSIVYVEVKPQKVVETEDFRRFLDLVQPVFRSNGSELWVVSDTLVKNRIVWANLREIHRQRHLIPDAGLAFQLRERLEATGPTHLGGLLRYHADSTYVRQTILALILRKQLSTDFNVRLDDDAVIYIPDPNVNPFRKEVDDVL